MYYSFADTIMSTLFKIESGLQLLARLSKKLNIENFYPVLFQGGPKQNEVIELYSENNINSLINDLICEALLPKSFGQSELSVLLLNCNASFNYNSLISCMRHKISNHPNVKNKAEKDDNDSIEIELLKNMLSHVLIAEVYDATQLYTTIHKLESIILEFTNIAMLIVNTVTAFYWTEQRYKIIKMDVYIKNLLQMIQKVTKDHKITIFYTRPEYFSSSKDSIEKLEACSELPVLEKVNYRIQIVQTNDDNVYHVIVRTCNNLQKHKLYMDQEKIQWM